MARQLAALKTNREELSEQEKKVASEKRDLEILSEKRWERVRSVEQALQERQQELAKQDEDLSEKAQDLFNKGNELIEKTRELCAKEAEVGVKGAELAKLSAALKERERAVTTWESKVKDWEMKQSRSQEDYVALISRIEEAQTKLEEDHKVLEMKYTNVLAKK